MSISIGNIRKRSYYCIWILIFILVTSLSFILSLLIHPFWWILLPISIFLIIIFQMMSHYFWTEEKICPRCNAPTTKYGDFCRNCGLKLWFRCISCGKYMRTNTKFCENCNIELDHTPKEIESFDYEIIKKDSPLPKKPNFCSNCGSELKNGETIKYCEECGKKI
ncbi:MAG: zinc ribbon domain-containing protein [Promethearchaeota archaeon]